MLLMMASTMIQTQSAQLAIDLAHVEKVYRGRVHALRGVNLRVHRGEVFGLLGPNGAGKSTLVKIMMTVVRPTRCDGSLLGQPIGHKQTLARVGYLPENHRFPRYLTGRQTLDFFAAMSKVPRRQRRKRAEELLATVGMSDWADRKVSMYSKGMMQRIGLAQALVNDPDLVLLDEPTDGVDPMGRRDIRDVILALRARGKTVFINSHMLSELEMICDRVAILVGGLVAAQGTLDELAIAKQYYAIELNDQIDPALLGSVRQSLGEVAVDMTDKMLRIATTDPAQVQPAIDALRGAGAVIRRVMPVRPSLEDLYIEAVGGPVRAAGASVGAKLGGGDVSAGPSPSPGAPGEAPPSPSPCTQGEGWGEGPIANPKSEIGNLKDPHPLPLPEYRARGQEESSARGQEENQESRKEAHGGDRVVPPKSSGGNGL